MLFRQDFDPMRQNEQVAPLEDWARLPAVPFGLLDELEHEVNIKPLILFYFEFFLDLADDSNKVEQRILDVH